MYLPYRLSLIAAAIGLAGCANDNAPNPAAAAAVSPAQPGSVAGTGIESQDIVAVTDQMARGILAVPQVLEARTPPHIVLEPIVNNTGFPIDQDVLLARIRAELNAKSQGRVRFLDREMLATLQRERAQQQTGQILSGPGGNAVPLPDADFLLTGRLDGPTNRSAEGASDDVVYTFRLTDARTLEVVWEDSTEIKKQGLEDVAYR